MQIGNDFLVFIYPVKFNLILWNWNKVKNNMYVRSKSLLFNLQIPKFIKNLKCHSTLINSVSLFFCEFNRVASWNIFKTIFSTVIISNSQIESLVSYSGSTNVNVNMSIHYSNFEENFRNYVFGKSFWHYRELKFDYWHSVIYYEKILKILSYVWRLEFL